MLWKDRYNLGVELIDEQHRELFNRVHEFLQILRSPVAWEERVEKVNETLTFMKDYVVTHFHDEEELQKEINYPEFDSHKKLHIDMVSYVATVAEQYEREGYDENLMQQFAGKLLTWLIHHVAAEDQKIADFANAKGGKNND